MDPFVALSLGLLLVEDLGGQIGSRGQVLGSVVFEGILGREDCLDLRSIWGAWCIYLFHLCEPLFLLGLPLVFDGGAGADGGEAVLDVELVLPTALVEIDALEMGIKCSIIAHEELL